MKYSKALTEMNKWVKSWSEFRLIYQLESLIKEATKQMYFEISLHLLLEGLMEVFAVS